MVPPKIKARFAMPVQPELVVFAIRAALRIGRAAQLELEDYIRNRDIKMPRILKIELDPVGDLRAEIQRRGFVNDEFLTIYNRYLEAESVDERHAAEVEIHAFALNHGLVANTEQATEERGLVTIQQWSEDADKGFPLARIGLAMVEVALEYIATNPGIFGIGTNGERFVRAMAGAIEEILPDSDAPGRVSLTPEQLFGERSLAIFMHTGLSTLQAHIAENVEEEHLRDIAVSILHPLINNFRDQTIERRKLNELRDLLLGPMAQEAINAVVRHQGQFLGSRFAKNSGMGAVTEAILKTIAQEDNVRNVREREVWIKVYGAILNVAIERPELFIAEDQSRATEFGQNLVQTVAIRLKDMTPPFTAAVAANVAADAISVLSRHTVILFDQNTPWEMVAGEAVGSVLESISSGMKLGLEKETLENGSVLNGEMILKRVFSEDQVAALVHIVTGQVAKTPAMLTGRETRDEVRALVAGIARAISDSNRALLSADDWLEVAAVVTREAAKNPGRLFRIIDDNGASIAPEKEFAVRLIKRLLDAAAADFRARGRAKGSVLFGETLVNVIRETIESAAGNVEMAVSNEEAMINLVSRINKLQGLDATGFGHKEWLGIYRRYLKYIMLSEDGQSQLDNLNDDDMMNFIVNPDNV
jgi:hypothetical protein